MAAGSEKKKKKNRDALTDRQTVSINGRLETTSVRLADITSVGAKLTQTTWVHIQVIKGVFLHNVILYNKWKSHHYLWWTFVWLCIMLVSGIKALINNQTGDGNNKKPAGEEMCSCCIYLQVVGTGQYSSQFLQFRSNSKRLPSRPTFKPAACVCWFRFTSVLEMGRFSDLLHQRGENCVYRG